MATFIALCLPNWVYFSTTDSCYFLGINLGLNGNDAEAYCVNTWGATLASIHSNAENDFIVGLAPEEDQAYVFYQLVNTVSLILA